MSVTSNSVSVRHVTIVNKLGLHARAAAKFVKMANCFDAEITVIKKDTRVSGSSIMGLMMFGAGLGCELELQASGPEAPQALSALADLVANRFDEDG